ncbi:SNARE associated Golgi protein [Acididesulfobacillus acetoxydans]|uniref:DedA protein n=1 Tax=Acididesulfobacillus acetoxydans TaxID=1561005 RepID=A0A8S0X509_9FIRM|nr:DedA family protein [Acididesulfobacillus acetoxydans]CAA7601250.1 SNARE associated Golgi protein [Acididesulfobacillus acetoxydans]CEJ08471.1 DedA protein [Acididesulfobacillus acetoxydans]
MTTLIAHLGAFVIRIISTLGYAGVFAAMALESACIPLPSEIILPFTGYMVFLGRFGLWQATLAATLGNLFGAMVAYYVGVWGGRPFLKRYGRYFFFNEREFAGTERIFARHGEITVFLGRVLPVVRTFISLPAGIARMNPLKVALYSLLGALPWCFLLILTGERLGAKWNALKPLFHRFDLVIGVFVVLALAFWIWRHVQKRN